MKKIHLIMFCFLLLGSAYGNSLENEIFDANRVKPVQLLYEAYQQSQVLLIGTSNHSNFQHYDRILELLKLVGEDPNLKYIVMERAHEVTGFYELLSTNDFEFAVNTFLFVPKRALTDNLCLNPEWSYTIKEFMPKIQEINRARFPNRPILVRAMEGMPADLSPGPIGKVSDGSCPGKYFTDYPHPTMELLSLSQEREFQTKSNFENLIWNDLRPNEKVIFISHYMHLIDGFHGCRPSRDKDGNWKSNMEPLTWLTPFFESHPEARDEFKLILIDEKDTSYNPLGGLKLVQRQAERYPTEDFAFSTHPFKEVALEIGTDMFHPTSTINSNPFEHHSNQKLDDVFYGVIWNSKAHLHSSLKRAHEYLPAHCATK